jgi:hypothetical protein
MSFFTDDDVVIACKKLLEARRGCQELHIQAMTNELNRTCPALAGADTERVLAAVGTRPDCFGLRKPKKKGEQARDRRKMTRELTSCGVRRWRTRRIAQVFSKRTAVSSDNHSCATASTGSISTGK